MKLHPGDFANCLNSQPSYIGDIPFTCFSLCQTRHKCMGRFQLYDEGQLYSISTSNIENPRLQFTYEGNLVFYHASRSTYPVMAGSTGRTCDNAPAQSLEISEDGKTFKLRCQDGQMKCYRSNPKNQQIDGARYFYPTEFDDYQCLETFVQVNDKISI